MAYVSSSWPRALSLGGIGPYAYQLWVKPSTAACHKSSSHPGAACQQPNHQICSQNTCAEATAPSASYVNGGNSKQDDAETSAWSKNGVFGLRQRLYQPPSTAAPSLYHIPQVEGISTPTPSPVTGFLSDSVFVFVAQLAAMTAFATLFMHIQVCYAIAHVFVQISFEYLVLLSRPSSCLRIGSYDNSMGTASVVLCAKSCQV